MAFTAAAALLLAAVVTQVHCSPAPAPEPAAANSLPAPSPTYTTKYDNFNIDMVLKNSRLLKNYVDCLMGRRKCTPEGQLLKGKQFFLFEKS